MDKEDEEALRALALRRTAQARFNWVHYDANSLHELVFWVYVQGLVDGYGAAESLETSDAPAPAGLLSLER